MKKRNRKTGGSNNPNFIGSEGEQANENAKA
jgi:hypothetical protein